MKKFYMIAAAMLASTAMLVQAQESQLANVKSLWGKALVCSGEKTTTIGGRLIASTDGNLYMIANAGTKAIDNIITLGDEQIASGTDYTGNGYNLNFILSKLGKDGSHLWTVSSTTGDTYSNEQWGTATPDGGIIVAFKVRHTQGHVTDKINFIDAKGDNTSLDWVYEDPNHKRKENGAVMKVSAEGAIEWVKMIEMDDKPQPKATYYTTNTPTGLSLYGIVSDKEGNLYLGGRMYTEMTVYRADGSAVTIAPHNVTNWDGDPQQLVGNTFILKLDADGNYLTHFVSGGESTCDGIRQLLIKDNKLYCLLTLKGKRNTQIMMGDKGFTPVSDYYSYATMRIDLNLKNVDWFNVYESSLPKSAINIPGMSFTKDAMWIYGQVKNEIKIGDLTLTTQHTRDAMFLKANPETGELINGMVKQQNQTGYFGAFEDQDNNLYAPTFSLFGPLKLEKINKETLQVEDQVDLFPTTATAQNVIADGNTLFVMSRFRGENLSSKPANPFTVTSPGFACLISAYQMPFKTATAVDGIEVEKSIIATEYYNVQGLQSKTPWDGINIVVTKYSDGSRTTKKILK